MKKLKYFLIKMIVKIRPEVGKRLVVVSMLLPHLKLKIDHDTLTRINESLDLCGNEWAMQFPMNMSDEILDREMSRLIDEELAKSESSTISDLVYRSLPEWLRYDYKTLRKDIEIMTAFKIVQ